MEVIAAIDGILISWAICTIFGDACNCEIRDFYEIWEIFANFAGQQLENTF